MRAPLIAALIAGIVLTSVMPQAVRAQSTCTVDNDRTALDALKAAMRNYRAGNYRDGAITFAKVADYFLACAQRESNPQLFYIYTEARATAINNYAYSRFHMGDLSIAENNWSKALNLFVDIANKSPNANSRARALNQIGLIRYNLGLDNPATRRATSPQGPDCPPRANPLPSFDGIECTMR